MDVWEHGSIYILVRRKEADRAERDKDSLSLWERMVSLETTHLLSWDAMLMLGRDTCILIVFLYPSTPP